MNEIETVAEKVISNDGVVYNTKDRPERYGGLLICGTNYGLERGKSPQPEIDEKGWAEYFTHYDSNRKKDRFINGIMRWFNWWGTPLEDTDGKPTELNLAITNTNLFYDKTKSFDMRSELEMKGAFKRLESIITKFDISGILIASSKIESLLNDVEWHSFKCFKLYERPERRRFWIRFGVAGTLPVALCPHPSSITNSEKSRMEVTAWGGEMQSWVEKVMKEYKRKQKEIT